MIKDIGINKVKPQLIMVRKQFIKIKVFFQNYAITYTTNFTTSLFAKQLNWWISILWCHRKMENYLHCCISSNFAWTSLIWTRQEFDFASKVPSRLNITCLNEAIRNLTFRFLFIAILIVMWNISNESSIIYQVKFNLIFCLNHNSV